MAVGFDCLFLMNHMLDALLLVKTPTLLSAVYRDCLWKVPEKEKVIYLTFDDGPIPEVTPGILDVLQQWNAIATFFCIGKNAVANKEILARIANEGHSIGNHTYDHLNGWLQTNTAYYQNMEACNEALGEMLHSRESLPLFRPPYGKLKPSQYIKLKSRYKLVMWDVLSFDFDLRIGEEQVLKNVVANTEAGSIVVFHDSLKAKPKVEYALPRVLEHFTALGYRFAAL